MKNAIYYDLAMNIINNVKQLYFDSVFLHSVTNGLTYIV